MSYRTLDIDELNERLAELEARQEAVAEAQTALDDATAEEEEQAQADLAAAQEEFQRDEREELKKLQELRDEIGERGGKIADSNGPFVHENDFEEYAMEFAEDIGAIPTDSAWPCTCIDWERAARELQMDYTSVDWDGVTYYYRG